MNLRNGQIAVFMACSAVGASQFGGCSTSVLSPSLPLTPPSYTQVPHPQGTDSGDLNALFQDKNAPQDPNFSKVCAEDFSRLKTSTLSKLEIEAGVDELVRHDPVHYHWCFYSRLAKLEDEIKEDSYVDERQKRLLEEYEFLVPVARVFKAKFYDSRYLRWAMMRYRKLSEWIFYRKLSLTPQGTSEFVQPERTFGLWRNPAQQKSVMEKYHLGDPKTGMWVSPKKSLASTTVNPTTPPNLPPLSLEMPLMPSPEGELTEALAPPPEELDSAPLSTPTIAPSPALSVPLVVPSFSPFPVPEASALPSPVVTPSITSSVNTVPTPTPTPTPTLKKPENLTPPTAP